MKVMMMMFALMSVGIANAKTSKAPAVYIVNGKNVSSVEALTAAMKNEDVLKCQSVELKPSKSGTSFSLKNKAAN